jgi:putative transposase
MKIEYNNLYTHFVFCTVHRLPLISEQHRERIEKYITGIVKNNNCHLYSIYANPEHIHFITSRAPDVSEEQLANLVSEGSENFINHNNLCLGRFQWQDSCSAFSVSKADVDKVCRYIQNQPEHHRKMTFAEEYDTFLKFYQKSIKPK